MRLLLVIVIAVTRAQQLNLFLAPFIFWSITVDYAVFCVSDQL